MDKNKSYLPVWATIVIFALIISSVSLIYTFYNSNLFLTISCLVILGFCVYVVLFNRINISGYEIEVVIGGLYFKKLGFEKIIDCEESSNFWLGEICITFNAEKGPQKIYLNPTNPSFVIETIKGYIKRDDSQENSPLS